MNNGWGRLLPRWHTKLIIVMRSLAKIKKKNSGPLPSPSPPPPTSHSWLCPCHFWMTDELTHCTALAVIESWLLWRWRWRVKATRSQNRNPYTQYCTYNSCQGSKGVHLYFYNTFLLTHTILFLSCAPCLSNTFWSLSKFGIASHRCHTLAFIHLSTTPSLFIVKGTWKLETIPVCFRWKAKKYARPETWSLQELTHSQTKI